MKLEVALVFVAAAVACASIPPESLPRPPAISGGMLVSEFHARAWGPGPTLRIRGILAWDAKGCVRAEIAAPSVATPLILVVTPDGILAVSISERIFYRGEASAPVLERLAGIPVGTQVIPQLLDMAATVASSACVARRGRWRTMDDARQVATRLDVRCDAGGMRLFLDSPRVAPDAGRDPFVLDPGSGYREVTLENLAASIETALRGRR